MATHTRRSTLLIRRGPRAQYVYFLLATLHSTGQQAIKIGWSHDPRGRACAISPDSVKSPDWMRGDTAPELTVLGYVSGDSELEHVLQREFHQAHLVGEWFDYSSISHEIDRLLNEHCLCATCEVGRDQRATL